MNMFLEGKKAVSAANPVQVLADLSTSSGASAEEAETSRPQDLISQAEEPNL